MVQPQQRATLPISVMLCDMGGSVQSPQHTHAPSTHAAGPPFQVPKDKICGVIAAHTQHSFAWTRSPLVMILLLSTSIPASAANLSRTADGTA